MSALAVAAASLRRRHRQKSSVLATLWLGVAASVALSGAGAEVEAGGAAPGAAELWLPELDLEDLECRRALDAPVVDWAELRALFQELVQGGLDPASLRPPRPEGAEVREWRHATQLQLLSRAAVVLLRFHEAVMQCPIGTVTASLFALSLAHMPRSEVSEGPLPQAFEAILVDLGRRPYEEAAARDLRLLLDIAPLQVVVATEWQTFAVLSVCEPLVREAPAAEASARSPSCAGTSVVGMPSSEILQTLRLYVEFASGKEMYGLKFLRGLDPLVTRVMRDPSEFSRQYVEACPPGAATLAVAAAMLALMSNPSLVERFANLAHHVIMTKAEEVVAGARLWGLYHALAKMAKFALRSFDLVWSTRELLPVPVEGPAAFDRVRLDATLRDARLREAVRTHPHESTRRLAAFLADVSPVAGRDSEAIVYLTAVGGQPFVSYLPGFLRRAVAVGLPGLIILCMDLEAHERCIAARDEGASRTLCEPAFDGHVVLIKHSFIPAILSCGVDTVWIDFDTFILRDPTPSLRDARDHPQRVLPRRSRVRYGSFLFEDAEEMCHLTKMCDPRQHWHVNITSDLDGPEGPDAEGGVEMLVTEHWDAKCLNNGLFYARASHRTLLFFVLFVRQLYINPYTDNQNLFDAFLAHSTVDTAAPQSRPLLRYASLDLKTRFACAEGHTGSVESLVTFHFWSSDFRTREAGATEGAADAEGRIRTRDGVERVSKASATKAELFELFLGATAAQSASGELGIPREGIAFIERVRVPPPSWKGMCSVTAVGVEELVDERLLQGGNQLMDWDRAISELNTPRSGGIPLPVPAPFPEEGGADADARPAESACSVPLRAWVEAMQAVGALEAEGQLSPAQADAVKARLRSLDLGYLVTIQAFAQGGSGRLGEELRRALAVD